MEIALAESVWSALSHMVDDLRNRGISVADVAMESLTDCRRLVNHFKLGHKGGNSGKIVCSVMEELRMLEDMLMIHAFQTLGEDYAEAWESRLSRIWSSRPTPIREGPPVHAVEGVRKRTIEVRKTPGYANYPS